MTIPEFSDAFDVLYNQFSSEAVTIEPSSTGPHPKALDEYEKSLFLTQAQEEIVVNLYNGKNPYNDSFESTEELRRYLDSLVRTKVFEQEERVERTKVSSNSVFYELPPDLLFITMEQVTLEDDSLGCYSGSVASVYPITQDEYNKVRENPFRGPTKYKVLRLDSGESIVELVSKYNIGSYLIKYLSKPSPIILQDLGEEDELEENDLTPSIEGKRTRSEQCELNPILHDTILKRAVQLALQAKGIHA